MEALLAIIGAVTVGVFAFVLAGTVIATLFAGFAEIRHHLQSADDWSQEIYTTLMAFAVFTPLVGIAFHLV